MKNHLEDTLLYSLEFYSDRISMIAAEIGLPSRLRGSIETMKSFFAIGKRKLKAQERQAGIRRTNAFIEKAKEMDLPMANGEDLSIIAMCAGRLALPTLVALCSLGLGKPVLSSMVVLGEISISGIVIKVEQLANVPQACLDNGAKKVLLPISSAGDLGGAPAELIGKMAGVI